MDQNIEDVSEPNDNTPFSRPISGSDVDTTGRNTHVESVNPNSQLATGSSVNVVDNKGHTMLGEKSTIVYNNNTYNITEIHYHNPVHPTHCQDCLNYHQNDHQLLAEHHRSQPESVSRHYGPHQYVPHILPSPQQTEQMKASNPAEPRQFSPIQKQVMDSWGRRLEPGDVLWLGGSYADTIAVYIENQQIVTCKNRKVLKERMDITEPFRKFTVLSQGECRLYAPEERVIRTKQSVGKIFTDGNGSSGDFPSWVYTGRTVYEALQKGFRWTMVDDLSLPISFKYRQMCDIR